MAHQLIRCLADHYGVPPEHVWGMTALESSFDPGAVGANGFDSGYCQINLSPAAHGGSIPPPQAFNPIYAFDYTCRRLLNARSQFSAKGPDLQDKCGIAQHNSPLAAKIWYEIGWADPDEGIAIYVDRVLARAETYPG